MEKPNEKFIKVIIKKVNLTGLSKKSKQALFKLKIEKLITNKRNKRTPINKSTALFNAADININTKENINKIQIIPLLSKIKLFLFPVNANTKKMNIHTPNTPKEITFLVITLINFSF
ncbi:hypothetical protein, partial [Acinetobacter baumannii]|uniref:hypothetical protein n=1 Tax=Acinetobacter baumannii TaxID=470 RepID=UPI001487D98D